MGHIHRRGTAVLLRHRLTITWLAMPGIVNPDKTEPPAALDTRVRAVDLAELLEDALALLQLDAEAGIADDA